MTSRPMPMLSRTFALAAAAAMLWLSTTSTASALEFLKPKKVEMWKVKHDMKERMPGFLKAHKQGKQAGAGLVDPCEAMVRPTDPPPMCGCPGGCNGGCKPKGLGGLLGNFGASGCATGDCGPAPCHSPAPCCNGGGETILDALGKWLHSGCNDCGPCQGATPPPCGCGR